MAAHDDTLHRFVHDALTRGMSRQEIDATLRKAGWPPEQIHNSLAAFAEVEFPIPVPRPRPYLSAGEAFLYLLLFSALYTVALNLGSLTFGLINRAFPDPAALSYASAYWRSAARWSMAALIVAFPVFLLVSRSANAMVRREPVRRSSTVRRWLTYLTLFLAASALIGDVMALVYNALTGELTIRFVLKVATVAVIGGAVLLNYRADVRTDERAETTGAPARRSAMAAIALGAAVLAALVAGFIAVGSPAEERTSALDARRVEDLGRLDNAIRVFRSRHNQWPASLDELTRESLTPVLRDPLTDQPYEYRTLPGDKYQLCAVFQRSSSEDGPMVAGPWSHTAGRVCFDRPETTR